MICLVSFTRVVLTPEITLFPPKQAWGTGKLRLRSGVAHLLSLSLSGSWDRSLLVPLDRNNEMNHTSACGGMLCSPARSVVRALRPVALHGRLASSLLTAVTPPSCLGRNNVSVFCPVSRKLCALFSHPAQGEVASTRPFGPGSSPLPLSSRMLCSFRGAARAFLSPRYLGLGAVGCVLI